MTNAAPHVQAAVTSSGRRTALWGAIDQVVYGGSNLALSLVVATSVGAASFGAFSVVLVLSTIGLGVVQGITSEVFTSVYGGASGEERRRAAAEAAGCALVLGLVVSAVAAAAALVTSAELSQAIGAFAVAVPFIFVQDVWRFTLFAARRSRSVVLNDGVWTVVQLAVAAGLVVADAESVRGFILAWAAGALVAAVAGAVQCRVVPRPGAALGWFTRHRHLGVRFSGEFLTLYGGAQAVLFAVGVAAGLDELGRFRAAFVLFAPAQGALNAARLVVTSASVRALAAGGVDRMAALRRRVEQALVVASVASSLGALLLPDAIGARLLGDSWAGIRPTLWPVAIAAVANATSLPSVIVLRALQEARASFRARTITAVVGLVLGVGGAFVFETASGAAWGLAASTTLGVVLIVREQRRAVARRRGVLARSAVARALWSS